MALASDAGDPDGEGSEILWMDIAEDDLDNDDREPEVDLFGGNCGGKPKIITLKLKTIVANHSFRQK